MIRAILFDIDNTIYSKHTGLQDAILENAKLFIKNVLYLNSEIDVFIKRLYNQYGNILSGLIMEFNIDPEEFIHFVFNVKVSNYLAEDLTLKRTLNKIPIPLYAFSNSPSEHIEDVLNNLGISDCFNGFFDRRFFNYKSKADSEVYWMVLNELGIDPCECILIDDNILNINIAKNQGINAILFTEENQNILNDKNFIINNILDIAKIPIIEGSFT